MKLIISRTAGRSLANRATASLSVSTRLENISSTPVTIQKADANITRVTSGTKRVIDLTPTPSNAVVSGLTSLSPVAVITDGRAEVASTGGALLEVMVNKRKFRPAIPVTVGSAATTITAVEWREGSYARFINDTMLAMLSGVTASNTTRSRFIPYQDGLNANITEVTHNPDLFCAAYMPALTAKTERMRQGLGGVQTYHLGGVAITKRHVVATAHQGVFNPGDFYYGFRGTDGVLHWRGVIASYLVGSAQDLVVYLLDSDLPNVVLPIKVAPLNLDDCIKYGNGLLKSIPAPNSLRGFLCLFTDRNALVNVCRSSALLSYPSFENPLAPYEGFFTTPIPGTSSNLQAFPLPSNGLLLIGSITTPGSASRRILDWPDIISVLDSSAGICTGYVPEIADLTSFTNYASTPIPAMTTTPNIVGTLAVGQTLALTGALFTNSPTSFSYTWKRNGVAISGANASNYLLTLADAGKIITCTITGINANGSSIPGTTAAVPIPN